MLNFINELIYECPLISNTSNARGSMKRDNFSK